MARDPFDLPENLHIYPKSFRVRPLDFDLGAIWPRAIDRRPWSEGQDETPFTLGGLEGYGPIWLDWLGGPRNAARLIRRVFEGKQGPETWYRARRPLLGLPGSDSKIAWDKSTVRATTRDDSVEQRFSFLALLILTGTKPNPDKGVAIRIALDVANLTARRDDAFRQGMFLGMLQARGLIGERALEVVAGLTKCSKGTVRSNRDRPFVKAVAAAFASGGSLRADSLPHLADESFAAGREREVAIGIAYRALECIKGGRHPEEALRWALLVLVEGYWRRDRALPDEVVYALAACLELLDREGCPRRDLSLAGVELRRAFMMFAASCAWEGFGDYYWPEPPADSDTAETWLSHPLHLVAKEAIRAQLRRAGKTDSKIEGDHSEEDSPSLL